MNTKKIGYMLLAGMLATTCANAKINATDASKNEEYASYVETFEAIKSDTSYVSLTPGRNEKELNVAYITPESSATPVVKLSKDASMKDAITFTGKTVSAMEGYVSNQITVTGLEENTTYYYQVLKNGKESEVNVYKTHSFNNFSVLFVGDPQIGASKNAVNDAFNWDRTLDLAYASNPNTSFILSAGDQVNKYTADEVEYTGYLSSDVLASLPVATTIGNHDASSANYMWHFNNPNKTNLGTTEAGGDYYYQYGNTLFIILNTNNYNCAEHEGAIARAVQSYPDAKWKVLMFHQDIYGTGLDHSDSDGMVLRTQITPLVDKYDIDVVLQGHDHTYSRTYMLESDKKEHSSYNFYDWSSLVDENGNIVKYEDEAYQNDNNCYVITDKTQGKVVNPTGTLYIESNSASGSKYYELRPETQDYIASKSQNGNPSYSVIDITDTTFTINTYEVVNGKEVQKIDESFTIEKTSSQDLNKPEQNTPQQPNEDIELPNTGIYDSSYMIPSMIILGSVLYLGTKKRK